MPLDNKCRIGPLAGAPPDTCAVVISTETESGFITEDDTSPVCHTPSCPRSKNPVELPMMWGQCDVVGAEVATLLKDPRDHLCSWDVLTLRDNRLYLLSTVASNYHIAPTEVAADTSIWLYGPYQSPSAARTAAGYVLRHPKSQYRYQSHQIRLDLLRFMLLNSLRN
ncbi:hypothetical protein TNCV_147011 [Trichonephila clavipes]|nr:hypothetical protein TNCV_147011 [Trichonephila clavipes]